jgi:hypothetical protein
MCLYVWEWERVCAGGDFSPGCQGPQGPAGRTTCQTGFPSRAGLCCSWETLGTVWKTRLLTPSGPVTWNLHWGLLCADACALCRVELLETKGRGIKELMVNTWQTEPIEWTPAVYKAQETMQRRATPPYREPFMVCELKTRQKIPKSSFLLKLEFVRCMTGSATCKRLNVCMYVLVCILRDVHMYVYVCIYTSASSGMHVVCMCVLICMCMSVHVCMCSVVNVLICTWGCVSQGTCMCVWSMYLHVCVCVCVFLYMHVCSSGICMCVYTRVCIYSCKGVCICAFAYLYTCMHVQMYVYACVYVSWSTCLNALY